MPAGNVLTDMMKLPAALTAMVLCASISAQQTVTIPANTAITVKTAKDLNLETVKQGDAVPLVLKRPLRVGKTLIAPADTPVTATVTQIQRKPLTLAVEIAPWSLPGGEQAVALSGNPLATKKGKFIETKEPTPKELDWYYRPSAGDIAELTGIGIIALPIVAIASPFLLIGALSGDDKKKLEAGHVAILRTAEDITVPTAALPLDKHAYTGQPVIYMVDRLEQHHRRVYCGTDAVWGDKPAAMNILRVQPGSYTFHTERSDDTTATVDTKVDETYLVYHDHAGLHSVAMADRPDLIDSLPVINEKTKFLFDTNAVKDSQKAAVERDKARGGCGIVKMLHERPKAAETKPLQPRTEAKTDTLKP